MMHWFVVALIVLFCDCYVRCLDNSHLDSVIVVFRHGDRTPLEPYPNDPYKNRSSWPVGFGQLTNEGKERQYQLGKWFRQRYDNFLPKEYSEEDIYVHSTDMDRTLMSASANLAGLYPPVPSQAWNQNLPWQPIPIHTIPQKDNVVMMTKNCPNHSARLEKLFESVEFKRMDLENQELYNYLSRHTGKQITTFQDLLLIFDALDIEQKLNFNLPSWTKKIDIRYLEQFWVLFCKSEVNDRTLIRLMTGPFFDQILNHFNMFARQDFSRNVDNVYWKQKFVMLSAHDNTIIRIMNALEAFDYSLPPYASTVIFELRHDDKGYNFINLFYKKDMDAIPIKLKPCNSLDCNYDVFKRSLQDIAMNPQQWQMECNT